MKVRACTVAFGVLECVVCALESVACMKLVTYCHLTEKSDTVKWVDVSMPHKRKRRLKDHKQLEELARSDPDTDDIYEESLLETHYPQKPDRLADVCLYDFVTKYDWQTKDKNGERKYFLQSPSPPCRSTIVRRYDLCRLQHSGRLATSLL